MKFQYSTVRAIITLIALIALVIAIIGSEEERMAQGNWREGTSFANLKIGDNLTISGVSLTFLGETHMDCADFPVKAQEECKKSKFFAFKINGSKTPLKVYQGQTRAHIVLEGTPWYENITVPRNTTVISSNGSLCVDAPTAFHRVEYSQMLFESKVAEFKIETMFKKS